ncbi:thioesterase family protein [Shewanella indica]|uniref:thioesterase family protein n=1 Tax=Shewanella indica TaxID=768528 RepID=UPI00399B786D
MQLSFSPWFHFQLQIYYEDTDFSGVVYHPNFLKYFERAREQVIGANKLKRLWQSEGVGFAVYRSELICQEGVEFADILDIRTRFAFESKYRTVWEQEIWRENAVRAAVNGRVEMVCMNRQRQLCPMPATLLEQLGAQLQQI